MASIDLDGDETSFNYEEKLLATTFSSSNLNKFCDINLDSATICKTFLLTFLIVLKYAIRKPWRKDNLYDYITINLKKLVVEYRH